MQNFTWKVSRHWYILYEWFGGWIGYVGDGDASWLHQLPAIRLQQTPRHIRTQVLRRSLSDFFPIPVLLWRLHMLLSFSEYYSTEAAKAFCQCHFSEEHIMCAGLTGWNKVYKGHYSELSHVLKGVVLTQLSPRLCSPSSTAACPKRGIHRRAGGWWRSCSQWPKYDHIQCESMKDDLSIRWSAKLTCQQQPPPRSLHIFFFAGGFVWNFTFHCSLGRGTSEVLLRTSAGAGNSHLIQLPGRLPTAMCFFSAFLRRLWTSALEKCWWIATSPLEYRSW